MHSKKERGNQKLEELVSQCREIEENIGRAEGDLNDKMKMHEGIEMEIEQNERTAEAVNEAVKERSAELDDLQRTVNDLESEIKTRRREKDE